jgi:hypothetical protein
MGLKKINLFTGTTIAVLLCAVGVEAAIASPSIELAQAQPMTKINNTGSYTGKIKSIVGTVVTLELPNGDTKEIGLDRLEQGRLGLVPGMRILVTETNGRRTVALAPAFEPVAVATRTTTSLETTAPVQRTERVERTERIERTTRIDTEPTLVETTPAPVTVERTEPAEVQPTRPIRALW